MLVRRKFAYISLLSENHRIFAKIAKKSFPSVRAHFLTFQQNNTPDFFDEKSRTKTGLGFKIGQSQRKYQRRPTLQSMSNPAVWFSNALYLFEIEDGGGACLDLKFNKPYQLDQFFCLTVDMVYLWSMVSWSGDMNCV